MDEDVTPTDLRPSLATAPYHTKVTDVSMYDKGPGLLAHRYQKLSEKGYEQRFERGFRRCREAKMGRKVPFLWSVRLHRGLF